MWFNNIKNPDLNQVKDEKTASGVVDVQQNAYYHHITDPEDKYYHNHAYESPDKRLGDEAIKKHENGEIMVALDDTICGYDSDKCIHYKECPIHRMIDALGQNALRQGATVGTQLRFCESYSPISARDDNKF